MIESFSHKGLKELFTNGKTSKLPQERLGKIKKILTVIDSAESLNDLNIPAFRLNPLKAPPFKGYWSIDVTGNFRIIFEFENGKAKNLNYLDTH
jgi:proteic killer suppression protein